MLATDSSAVLIRTAHRDGSAGPPQVRVFVGSCSVAVLDSARTNHDADDLGIALMRQLETIADIDLAEAVSTAVKAVAPEPSTSVSVVRWSAADVDVVAVGSIPVVTRHRDGSVYLLRNDYVTWPVEQVEYALVLTDGAAVGVDVYAVVPDWATALTVAADNPQALVDAVHAAEAADPHRSRWPRSMIHDDKAAAVITFGPSLA
jgi:hypothetical protein